MKSPRATVPLRIPRACFFASRRWSCFLHPSYVASMSLPPLAPSGAWGDAEARRRGRGDEGQVHEARPEVASSQPVLLLPNPPQTSAYVLDFSSAEHLRRRV